MPPSRHRRIQGFTIVEVMMAAMILVVAFFGMIQAITIGSEMMATARRQTAANQAITSEIERLRLRSWAEINLLTTTTDWATGTAYAVGDSIRYKGGWFTCVRASTGHLPTESAYWAATSATWSATRTYSLADVVYYPTDGNWYRYISTTATSGNLPTSTSYWESYSGPLVDTIDTGGVTLSITRAVTDVTPDLREVVIVVSWTKSGTNTAANAASGSWLQQFSFYGQSPIARTYTRTSVAYFTKYGLNLSTQRS